MFVNGIPCNTTIISPLDVHGMIKKFQESIHRYLFDAHIHETN